MFLSPAKLRGLISLGITAIISFLLLMMPVYSSGKTLLKVNGPRVFGVLAIPIVIAIVPLVLPGLKTTAAVVMFIFVLIAGFSIGLFYLPAAVLLAWPERRYAAFQHGPSATTPVLLSIAGGYRRVAVCY